jgi:hypothetical protein
LKAKKKRPDRSAFISGLCLGNKKGADMFSAPFCCLVIVRYLALWLALWHARGWTQNAFIAILYAVPAPGDALFGLHTKRFSLAHAVWNSRTAATTLFQWNRISIGLAKQGIEIAGSAQRRAILKPTGTAPTLDDGWSRTLSRASLNWRRSYASLRRQALLIQQGEGFRIREVYKPNQA